MDADDIVLNDATPSPIHPDYPAELGGSHPTAPEPTDLSASVDATGLGCAPHPALGGSRTAPEPSDMATGEIATRLLEYAEQFIPPESQAALHRLVGWLHGKALSRSQLPAAPSNEAIQAAIDAKWEYLQNNQSERVCTLEMLRAAYAVDELAGPPPVVSPSLEDAQQWLVDFVRANFTPSNATDADDAELRFQVLRDCYLADVVRAALHGGSHQPEPSEAAYAAAFEVMWPAPTEVGQTVSAVRPEALRRALEAAYAADVLQVCSKEET